MNRFRFGVLVTLLIIAACDTGIAQSPPVDWVDYISGDYDMIPNITYSRRNNTEMKLDIYFPRNRPAPLPTLVLFHGGGWVAGQKERSVFQLLPYLSLGWVVINVEYRLASNSLAPAAVEDCRCALQWTIQNAKTYGIDTSRIVLTGGSAGGHLALITGMLPSHSLFDRACPSPENTRWINGDAPALRVAAIVNWFGITDVADLLEGANTKRYAVEWLGGLENRQELARQVSPITYVRSGLPPVITIHGNEDNVVPYSHATRLHTALDKAGVPNQLITVPRGKHGGFDRKTMIDSFAAIREFLRKHNVLKGG